MMRPRFDDMRVALSYGFDAQQGLISGNGGNPYLRPIRSNSFDVTVEKYFGTRGYLAAQGFYKDLKSFVYNLEQPYDYTGLPLPASLPQASRHRGASPGRSTAPAARFTASSWRARCRWVSWSASSTASA